MDDKTFTVSIATILNLLKKAENKKKREYKIGNKNVCRKVFRFVYGKMTEH